MLPGRLDLRMIFRQRKAGSMKILWVKAGASCLST